DYINRIAYKLKLLDGKEEIKKLLEVVKYFTQEREEQIYLDDVVDVFKGELVQFALIDLVVRELVKKKSYCEKHLK
ncbi:12666_t:CDS:2, partial [Funneliformis geosporum]